MLDDLRLLLAVALFCLGLYLCWDLLATGFNLWIVLSALGCFIAAHFVKPNRADRDTGNSLINVMEFIVDIPYSLIAKFLRALFRTLDGVWDFFT